MIVVSDNSPLQYLVLLGCVDVLSSLLGEVVTTPQVLEELRQPRTPQAVRAWAARPPAWLKIEAPVRVDFLEIVDLGEASAISLARERNADLILIDDRAGTKLAHRLGIQFAGTVGLLIEAGLEKLLDFENALDRLGRETSFYSSPRLMEEARRIFRERQARRS
jgi:predicted nucleic acid-binding protein